MPGASTLGSDIVLQSAPTGRVYYSALVVRGTGAASAIEGLYVAWTDDAGARWIGGQYQAPVQSPGAMVISPDRQWLAFGPGSTVYMTYNQIPSGIWIARSDDAGSTWAGWTRAAAIEQRTGGVGQSGPPIVDAQGRVFVPACEGNSGAMDVFRSDDKGATWAKAGASPFASCSWFPMLARDGDELVAASWTQEGVATATSSDGGKTWSKPVAWSGASSAAPWPIPTNGTIALAYYADDSGSSSLHVARGTAAGPVSDVRVIAGIKGSSRTSANTDYASLARLPDGRLAVVWTDLKTVSAAVSAP
jgi:hypothetical protein